MGEKLHFEVVLRQQQQQHYWCWVVLLGWVPDQALAFVVVVWLSFYGERGTGLLNLLGGGGERGILSFLGGRTHG